MNVSACIATRGDVNMSPILDSLPENWEVVLWNNGLGLVGTWRPHEQLEDIEVHDLGPYGRFAAIAYASHEIIYVQDDDVIVSDPEAIVAEWWRVHGGPEWRRLQGGTRHLKEHLVANMPQEFRAHYPDSAMVGFGAVFHRNLPEVAFQRFFNYHTGMTRDDPLFLRESCRVFTGLTPRVLVDVAKTDLPYASDPNRLWKQPVHVACRERMLHLVRQVP
jgi:hypothetical protein